MDLNLQCVNHVTLILNCVTLMGSKGMTFVS